MVGNRYIPTLCDYFTKGLEAIILPTKEAAVVAKSFLRYIFKIKIMHEELNFVVVLRN